MENSTRVVGGYEYELRADSKIGLDLAPQPSKNSRGMNSDPAAAHERVKLAAIRGASNGGQTATVEPEQEEISDSPEPTFTPMTDKEAYGHYWRAMDEGRAYKQAVINRGEEALKIPAWERTEQDEADIAARRKVLAAQQIKFATKSSVRDQLSTLWAGIGARYTINRERGVAYLTTYEETRDREVAAFVLGAVAVVAVVWLARRGHHQGGIETLPNPHLHGGGNGPEIIPNLPRNPHHLGQKLYVEHGSGIIREIKERAAGHGKPITDHRAFEIYEKLRGRYGNHIMHHVGQTYDQSTYFGPHDDVRLATPGTYRLNPHAQHWMDELLGIAKKKKKLLP